MDNASTPIKAVEYHVAGTEKEWTRAHLALRRASSIILILNVVGAAMIIGAGLLVYLSKEVSPSIAASAATLALALGFSCIVSALFVSAAGNVLACTLETNSLILRYLIAQKRSSETYEPNE